MFIVSIFGKKQLFLNSKTDDFVRLLPEQFDCDESDIEVEYLDEADQKAIRREMKINPDKNYRFDLFEKKLIEFVPPKFRPGEPRPGHILNKQAKQDGEPSENPNAIDKNDYDFLENEEKILYLKSIAWTPRQWEVWEYSSLIGSNGADVVFNSDSPECKESVREVLTFKTKKVTKINYTPTVNSLTGEPGVKVESMEFEE
jgi:hypothetical protein